MRASLITYIMQAKEPTISLAAAERLADHLLKAGVRIVPPIYSEGIEKLNFTKGIYQLLRRNNIKTVDDLCSKTMREIRNFRGVGDKAFAYILRTMEEHDLMFAPDLLERRNEDT